jgi:hypothetical protein
MNLFSPQTGSEPEWNIAYYRLEDYLRAMHFTNKLQQNQVILRLLRAAAARHVQNPEIPPTTLALDVAHEEMDSWFKLILADQGRSPISGRVSLLITEAMKKWPEAFLNHEPHPDCHRALAESEVRAGPDLQVSNMVTRPFDFGPLAEIEFHGWRKRTLFLPLALFGGVVAFLILWLSH